MEGALGRAGYADAEFTVRRADARGATEARWSWIAGAAELTSEEWPDGLELVWNSSAGWAYQRRGGGKLVALPVPVLAAPDAITALLPALMDGRRDQLPASEDRWEHAAVLVSWAETASALGDDKYDAAYQRAEEEAEGFSRWQAQLDGALPDAAVQSAAALDGTDVGTDRQTQSGAERPNGADATELARRTHVNVILEWARKALADSDRRPNPELFGILTDYFTRAIVFPGHLDPRDGQRHTSDPSRALAHLLLQHLEHHGLDMEGVPELELPESSVAPVGDALAESVAQALRASRWFADAAAGTGSVSGRVAYRTVFGAQGVLHVADAPAADETA